MADRIRPPRNTTADSSSVPFLQTSKECKPRLFHRLASQFIYGTPHFAILSGDAGMIVAREVGSLLQKNIPENPPIFSNNESRAVVPRDIETKDVYIVQSANENPDRCITQLKLLSEGAKGVGANRITAILTHLPYSRQDRREQPGAPEAARLFAREIIRAGSHDPQKRRHESRLKADATLLVVDVHSENPLEALTRNNNYQWANLDSAVVLAPAIQRHIQEKQLDVVVAFPDAGAAKRYRNYADMFGGGIEHAAVIKKDRDKTKNNSVKIADDQKPLSEKVTDKDVVLVDDIIDSGGTTLQAAKYLKEQGAKSVTVVATHGIFSGKALERMADSAIDRIIITDTITPRAEVLIDPKIDIVPIAPLIAEVIRRIEQRESIADLVKKMSPGFEKSYMKWGKINTYRRRNRAA